MKLCSLLFICLGLLETSVSQTDTSQCPSNLSRDTALRAYGDKCYHFTVHRHVDWLHADSDCRKLGGNLVVIHNEHEQNFLMSSLQSLNFQGNGVWIGLHDEGHQRVFRWVTGEPSTYTYWAPGQPGSLGDLLAFDPLHLTNEDCVLMKYHDSGHWHDYPCSAVALIIPENYGWICEFAKVAQPTPTSPPSQSPTSPPSHSPTSPPSPSPTSPPPPSPTSPIPVVTETGNPVVSTQIPSEIIG